VMVLQGSAALEIDGARELHRMAPGDYVWLPPRKRHRVAWTEAGRPTAGRSRGEDSVVSRRAPRAAWRRGRAGDRAWRGNS
jgi:glyoxylate utilization-related uncharacterized protein